MRLNFCLIGVSDLLLCLRNYDALNHSYRLFDFHVKVNFNFTIITDLCHFKEAVDDEIVAIAEAHSFVLDIPDKLVWTDVKVGVNFLVQSLFWLNVFWFSGYVSVV